MSRCVMCGRPTHDRERHIRFRLPDPVLSTELQDEAPGTWRSHGDAATSVMLIVPQVGPFVRALLPVLLSGGSRLVFGVWVAVHPDDLRRAFNVWWEPEYSDLRLSGYLANAVAPWGLLAAPVELAVLDPEQTPYCVASADQRLQDVLGSEWPHDVLDAMPDGVFD